MTGLPTGTVTLLFTDVEGSTKLWERDPEAMSQALSRHDELLRNAVEDHGGFVFKTVGDAFYAAFSGAPEAVEAALDAQRSLLSEEWEGTGPLKVRMALRTGTVEERDGDYFGPTLNRVARLLSAGHGGQVLLSLSTQELVRDKLPLGTGLRDLGVRRLKDLFRPEHVFQLTAPDLPASFPPLETLDVRLNNLPIQPTPLLGREREVAQISDSLGSADLRLLTLTGTGGTGKTRLALQSAAELIDEFEDGVFFVALASISDPELVASTVAGALSVSESAGRDLGEELKDFLRNKELLLVLDNFEQVVDAAPLVGELLSACPGLKVLVTSRTPLRIYGEHEYAVRPLELADPRRLPPLERLRQYEAIKLFIERAQAARADFSLTNENAPAVAEICARLDGLPLAIELAAARIKLFSPQAMCSRLGDPLKFLTGGARDLPERQRTLRGAIAWSHALLDEAEQALFARLSVFSGGCGLEAVEAICDADGDLSVDVLEDLSSLVDKSILRQKQSLAEEPRFAMLKTIREYARERLEASGSAEEIRRLHAEYFLLLAEEGESKLRGPKETAWLEHLDIEHDNMRAALSWALESGEAGLGLRLAGALWRFWWMRGHYSEGRRWLEEALANDEGASAARAKALEAVGWLADDQGDIDRAVAAAEEGLDIGAQVQLQSSLRASFLRMLGSAAYVRGDHEQAARLYKESLALSREAGNERGVASSLLQLGNALSDLGDHEEAKKVYEEGLALSRKLDDKALLGSALISVGAEFLLQGDHERGAILNEEAARLYRERGNRGGLQYALDNLGWAALMRGDQHDAEILHRESLVLSRQLGDKLVAAEALDGLACSASAGGDAARVARLFGAAEGLREAVGYRQEPREHALREPYLALARPRLPEARWDAAYTEGRRLGFEGAISYALDNDLAD
ncbi:MAG: tetratricopeptide repeat protein [Actinomycetota bacterium]|nr:tetratricopeptide repeat protein [Actinomycetota bacterium]